MSHAYCGACLEELRAKHVSQVCPLCKADLPASLEGLYDLAWRMLTRIEALAIRENLFDDDGNMSLPPAQQEELDEAAAMLREAAAQVGEGIGRGMPPQAAAQHAK